MIRLACFLLLVGSLWAQEAPTGIPVDPSTEEQQALKRISGQIQGKIVWSTSRANSKHDIWIMNADGTGAKALTKSNQVDWFPRFSPDGSKVIFNRSKSGWVPENDANYPEKWDIWQIGSDGTGEQKIISNATWATYRPDGKAIIFSRAAQVFSFDIATKKETLLIDGEVIFNKKGVILQEPNMSPDGKHIAITLRGSMRETGVWDLEKKVWTKSGDGCQIDWFADGSRLYRVNPTGNGGTAAPSEILWFTVKDGKPVEKIGFFGIPQAVRLMDLPGRRSHEYFPRVSPDGKWLVWGATDKGHDHDIYDYELYIWKIGSPVNEVTRITYHTGNDRWPDIWLGTLKAKKEEPKKDLSKTEVAKSEAAPARNIEVQVKEFRIKNGQSIFVEESYEKGSSLRSLRVYTRRAKLDVSIALETDKVSNILLEDLTGDGLEDLVLITESAAEGGFKDVYAFVPQEKGSLAVVPLFSWDNSTLPSDYKYKGNDQFNVENGLLVRTLPGLAPLKYRLLLKENGFQFTQEQK